MVMLPRSAHARTATVAVIDSGIDVSAPNLCKFGHKSFVKRLPNPLTDEHGHGTHIAGLISSAAGSGDYCLVSIKYYDEEASGRENLANMIEAIKYAADINVRFINISGGGPESNEDERLSIRRALIKNIKVVVAAGNENSDLDKECNYFPACYDNRIVVVGNLKVRADYRNLDNDWKFLAIMAGQASKLGTLETERSPSSNYGKRVTRWEVGTNLKSTLPGGKMGYMSGTSQATAVATGKLLSETLKK